jgi:hypothetical protein
MDIRLKTAPYTFDGMEMTLCCNMNVLADVQEYFDGNFGRALEKRRTLQANIVFLTAMINDYLDSIGSTKRYEVREVGRKLPTLPAATRELSDIITCLVSSALIKKEKNEDEEKNLNATQNPNL